jgi:glutamate carboxypeptidase
MGKVDRYSAALDWIASQQERMLDRLVSWARINSYSLNTPGLAEMAAAVLGQFAALAGKVEFHDLPPMVTIDARGNPARHALGRAITIEKRPDVPIQVLLNIHFDTVYPPEITQPVRKEADVLRGPGVADAKGGLAVMLTTLEALERSEHADRIGWKVVLNPDEEVGSPGSAALLAQTARRCQFGLLFEPALPDGALVDRRRGSGNFSILVRGKAAHAGRDFAAGRSALLAAARLSLKLHELNAALPGVTLNIGAIDGGGPANVVPDLAICRLNIRTTEPADEQRALNAVKDCLAEANDADGISAELHGHFASPPKIADAQTASLLEAIKACGRDLGMELVSRASGGASDGNRLSAAGLPNIDTLGVRGDRIHSPDEFMIPKSLVERAQLAALLLLKIAAGDIDARAFSR